MQITQKASQWLAQRLEELQKKQSEAEKGLKEYVSKQPVKSFESLPEVLTHPTIVRLKDTETDTQRKISELSKQYGPAHPKMLALKSELETIQNNIRKEIRTVTDSLSSGSAAEMTGNRLGQKNQKNAPFDNLTSLQKTTQLHNLQREVSLTGSFITSSNALKKPSYSAIPTPPTHASSILQLSVAVAGQVAYHRGLSLPPCLLHRYWPSCSNTSRTPSNRQRHRGSARLPTLGILPDLAAKGLKTESHGPSQVLSRTTGLFAEAVRTIRTGVMLSSLDEPHKVVLVASAVSDGGKTTGAMNLALALRHLDQKVLLIDADMRKPSIGKLCGLPTQTPGLSNLVAGSAGGQECIHKTKEGLDILPSGIIPPNPLELLSSRRFAELLNQLSERYSRIVIDSPPISEVSDALILATKASAVVYVIKGDATSYQVVQRTLKRLRAVAKTPIIGAVLNLVDITATLKRDVEAASVNQAFLDAAATLRWRGILGIAEPDCVSRDFTGRTESVVMDLELTRMLGNRFVKVFGWHDNETGYAERLVELVMNISL